MGQSNPSRQYPGGVSTPEIAQGGDRHVRLVPKADSCTAAIYLSQERAGLWSSRAMTASAARSPFCHAPPTVPQNVWWTASPANQTTSFKDADKTLRASCAPGGAEENAPRVQGSLVQDVACAR